jgi:hypothetical protein
VLVKSPTKEITHISQLSINWQETVPASEKSEERRKTLKIENSQQFLSILNQSSTHSQHQKNLDIVRKKGTRISSIPSGIALQQSIEIAMGSINTDQSQNQSNERLKSNSLSQSTQRVDQIRSNNFELEPDQRTVT